MTRALPQGSAGPRRIRQALPYLVLIAGLTLATAPAWRTMLFGSGLTIDDLLQVRCLTSR